MTGTKYDWNRISDVLYTSHEAFVFFDLAFYFRMFKKTVDSLIDTGVMKYLTENYYSKKKEYIKASSTPKVLTVKALAFGFNIWLGVCGCSIAAFIAEISRGKWKKNVKVVKVKFAKVHPLMVKEDQVVADTNFEFKTT